MIDIEWVLVNIVGNIGVALIVIAYFSLTLHFISSHSIRYSLLNLCGSIFIGVSLIFQFNLPSAVIEVCWAIIAIYGLVKALLRRYRNTNHQTEQLDASSEKSAQTTSAQPNTTPQLPVDRHQQSDIIKHEEKHMEHAHVV